MTSKKRERELARAKYERQVQRRAEEQARRRRWLTIGGAVIALAVVAGGLFYFLRPTGSNSATPSDATSPTAAPSPSPSGSATGPVTCKEAPKTRADDKKWSSPPEQRIKEGDRGTYEILFATNCGDIKITLDSTKAPVTSNSMIFLTNEKFFDLTACHRLTTEGIFVLQCGDPTASGTGGPGYSIPDENLPKEGANDYPAGTVAMANSGPNTNGSQFFIVYKDTTLPPNYTIWGTVSQGLDIVKYVASKGVKGGGTDGPPAQPLVIEKGTTYYTKTVDPQ